MASSRMCDTAVLIECGIVISPNDRGLTSVDLRMTGRRQSHLQKGLAFSSDFLVFLLGSR